MCSNPSIESVRCLSKERQSITMEITLMNGALFIVTVVYASIIIVERREMWDSLVWSTCNINVPFMVLGGFQLNPQYTG